MGQGEGWRWWWWWWRIVIAAVRVVVPGGLNSGCLSGGAKPQDHEMQSFSRKTKKEKHDSRIMLLTWGIFAIIIGISSIWWWQNQKNDDLAAEKLNSAAQTQTPANTAGEESPTTTDFTSLEALEDAEDQQIETQATAAQDSAEEPAADAEQPADEVAEIQEPTEPEAAEPTTSAVAENHLVMSFDADCWIQVKDASGKTLATGVKKAGQSVELLGTKPYRVVLGAPENVSMTLASEPVDLSGYTSGKVARFTLP